MPSTNGSAYLSTGEASRILNCHENSLRNWASQGKIPFYKLGPGGNRRFLLSDLHEFLGIENESDESQLLIYARVSTNTQGKGFSSGEESNLTRQIDRLKEFAHANFKIEPIVFADVGSGLNYQRRNFAKMIGSILEGQYDNSTLLCEWKDRLSRFSVELIQQILTAHKINLVFTKSLPDISSEAELSQDLISIVSIFAARTHGVRGAAATRKELNLEAIEKIQQLRKSGLSFQKISDRMNEMGFTSKDGSPVSISMTRKYCNAELELVQNQNRNDVEAFIADCLEVAGDEVRVLSRDVYAEYERWAKTQKAGAVSTIRFGVVMGQHFRRVTGYDTKAPIVDGKLPRMKKYCGFTVKGKEIHHTIKPRKKPTPLEVEHENSFLQFYNDCLAGKFSGNRAGLDSKYFSWCEEHNHQPVSRTKIPSLLRSINKNNIPAMKKKRVWYDFTKLH